MLGLLFLFAVVAVVAAVIFFAQARGNGAALLALQGDIAAARKDADEARGKLKDVQEESRAKGAQLVEVREKLADARKKGQEQKGGKLQSRGVREAELIEDLAHARQLIEEAHASDVAARKEAGAAKLAAAGAAAELKSVQEKLRELAARLATAPVQAGSAVAAPVAAPLQDDGKLKQAFEAARESEKRAADAERLSRELRVREAALREDLKKSKGRAETNNRVYVVTRGELELTRERLAQAERRLWQAGITMPVPAARERPKATGPAAAEKPAEAPASAEAAPSAAAAPAADAAPAVEPSAPVGDAQAAVAEAGAPAGIVRRRPTREGEAAKPE